MSYFKVSQKTTELQDLRSNGWVKGERTGFDQLDEFLTLKKGYPLFLAGAPFSGKTEFVLELLLNASVIHGWKHFIYLGENGEVEEVIADLAYKYIGKPYKKEAYNSMSESERCQAEMFIDEHFVLVDDSRDMSLTIFYSEVKCAENELRIKFDTTLFDPFNDVIDESSKFGGRDDKWLANELKMVRRSSKENNRIDILVNHIADIYPVTDKTTGKRYTPVALPSEWAGGRTWWRRAFTMILVYRPPDWLNDDNGQPYGENVSLIHIQKAKPKGVAKTGHSKLYWDWKSNRYYWIDNAEYKFAFKINNNELKQPKALAPNMNEWIEPVKQNIEFEQDPF